MTRRFKRQVIVGRIVAVDHGRREGVLRLADGSGQEWPAYFTRGVTDAELQHACDCKLVKAHATWSAEWGEFFIFCVKPLDC